MKFLIPLIISLSLASSAILYGEDSKDSIPGEYLVIFKEGISQEEVALHLKNLPLQLEDSIKSSFLIGTFKGFSAKMSPKLLQRELSMPDIAYVETNKIITMSDACILQQDATWGLNRVDERQLDLDDTYVYPDTAGAGVDSYIVDTGILTTHDDFQGRAIWSANFADTINSDCNGHGTHVAGTVGGKTWGIAKQTTLLAVKVLNCAGSGTTDGVVKGIEFTVTSYTSRKRPSVANMSLGGGLSPALDNAVKAAVTAGVTFVVAAGNSNADACNFSPANAPLAVTVGATTVASSGVNEIDARSTFSNYGKCVDIFAPGELITSAWIGSNTATRTISGTSMASPHVAGVAALYLSDNPTATTTEVAGFLTGESTPNLIDLRCGSNAVCKASPNALLYSPCS